MLMTADMAIDLDLSDFDAPKPARRPMHSGGFAVQVESQDWEVTSGELQRAKQQRRWQSLWVTLVEMPWRTLAVVPVGAESMATQLGNGLVEAAHAMGQVCSSGVGPLPESESSSVRAHRHLMLLQSPLQSPRAALHAKAANAVILVVALGEDTLEQTQLVRDLIGAQRILGCVAVNA